MVPRKDGVNQNLEERNVSDFQKVNNEDDLDTQEISHDIEEGDEDYDDEESEELSEDDFDVDDDEEDDEDEVV